MRYKAFFWNVRMRLAGGLAAAGFALAVAGAGAIAYGAVSAVPLAIAGSAGSSAPFPASPTPVSKGPATGAGRSAPSAARPALWRTYVLIVDLHDLPRTYTCDELWYEFHGILQRLGAWPYTLNILPYDCSPSASGSMKSPRVQVQFQLPIFLQGVSAKSAPAMASERTIRLSPGEPTTLHAADCQLMQQISQTLLPSISVHIDSEHFDCSGPPRRAGRFNVRLSLPMGVNIPTVPATSDRGPH